MKRRILWMIAVIALSGSALFAQTLTGTWQGTLKAGAQDLRLAIKISLDDDKLKAVSYAVDMPGQIIPASAITQSGSTVKITFAAVNGSYEGKLGADGNTITGTSSAAQADARGRQTGV